MVCLLGDAINFRCTLYVDRYWRESSGALHRQRQVSERFRRCRREQGSFAAITRYRHL